MKALTTLASGALLFAASACGPPTVVRSAGGELMRGRFISPQAYEAYARGALAEAEGRLRFAAAAYHRAAQIDPDGPEAWTRLGAVLCKDKDTEGAEEAFGEAERADGGYAPLYRERARCELASGRLKEALSASERAMVLDPEDEDTWLLRARILAQNGQADQAVRELFARLVAGPKRARVAALLSELATDSHDAAAKHFAQAILASAPPEKPESPEARAAEARQELDAALRRGDLSAARRLGVDARVTPGGIALRAAASGQAQLANEQARLVLEADPKDVDAAIASLAAGGAGGAVVPSTALALSSVSRQLSRLERLVLVEALLRRVGPEAAASAAAGLDRSADGASADPLETTIEERLRRAGIAL
jgi:tetratricopeptide (TPR) repeat protein